MINKETKSAQDVEPSYRIIAKKMLEVDKLPSSLESKLKQAQDMILKVKPYGELSSTQVIASIIGIWKLEMYLQDYIYDLL